MANFVLSLFCLQLAFPIGALSFKVVYDEALFLAHAPFGEGGFYLVYRNKMEKIIVGNIRFTTTGEGCVMNNTSYFRTRNLWRYLETIQGDVCELFYRTYPLLSHFVKYFVNDPKECPWVPYTNISIKDNFNEMDYSIFRKMLPKSVTAVRTDVLVKCNGSIAFTGNIEVSFDRADEMRTLKPRKRPNKL